jgi:ribose 5-phosphate isomerase B
MLIAIGCDHAGYTVKTNVIGFLQSLEHKVIDCGCFSSQSCDYPDYALPVAEYVSKKKCDRGILICGTGIGMSIVANKVPGIRATVCWSVETAKLTREHNDANILCLSARFLSLDNVFQIIKIWLDTPFSNEPRHINRLNKLNEIDEKYRKRRC